MKFHKNPSTKNDDDNNIGLDLYQAFHGPQSALQKALFIQPPLNIHTFTHGEVGKVSCLRRLRQQTGMEWDSNHLLDNPLYFLSLYRE